MDGHNFGLRTRRRRSPTKDAKRSADQWSGGSTERRRAPRRGAEGRTSTAVTSIVDLERAAPGV
jgi:hypothetical protein